MRTPLAICCAIILTLCICSSADAQLQTPVIDTSNVGWGWFTLEVKPLNVTPKFTRWTIMYPDGGDTLLDKSCSRCDGQHDVVCPGPLYADDFDLLHKEIIGCAADTEYVAIVQYNDGTTWSSPSTPIRFRTPPEPAWSGDTVDVVLWGHSFISYGPDCSVINQIHFGNDYSDPNDNIGHIIQTILRRELHQPIVVINRGEGGSNQYDWIHSASDTVDSMYSPHLKHYDTTYLPGGSYANHSRYPVAAFFFGDNDAANQYPANLFAQDIHKVIDKLTGLGVRVVYNSIHYTTASDYSSPDREVDYYNTWDSVMTGYANDPMVWRGFDYYHAFQAQPTRFLGLDSVHPDFSEGIVEISKFVGPIIQLALANSHTAVDAWPALSSGIPITASYPNPANDFATLDLKTSGSGNVTVRVVDMLGRQRLSSEQFPADGNRTPMRIQTASLQPGIYDCVVDQGGVIAHSRIIIVR